MVFNESIVPQVVSFKNFKYTKSIPPCLKRQRHLLNEAKGCAVYDRPEKANPDPFVICTVENNAMVEKHTVENGSFGKNNSALRIYRYS